jgi:hypothetical protein
MESFCSWDRGRFGNPEEGERPPLEAATTKPVKTQQAEKTIVRAVVICRLRELVKRL